MKKMMTVLSLVLAVLLCAMPVMTGLCEAAEAPVNVPLTDILAGSGDDEVMTVNGHSVKRSEITDTYNQLLNYYSSIGYDMSTEQMQGIMMADALNVAISYSLLYQKADELGVNFTEAEEAEIRAGVEEDYESIVQMYMTEQGLGDDASDEDKAKARAEVLAMLESYGYSAETEIESALQEEVFTRVENAVCVDINVTDEEVENAYNEQLNSDMASYSDVTMYEMYKRYYGIESLYRPKGYRGMLQILLAVDEQVLNNYNDLQAAWEEQNTPGEDGATPTDIAEADRVTEEQLEAAKAAVLAAAETQVKEILDAYAAGVSFTDLIAKYNTDPGMQDEETLKVGYEVHKDSITYVPEFTAACFTMDNIGELSDPFVSSYGVHIVMYNCDLPSVTPLDDELRASMKEELTESLRSAAFNEAMMGWYNDAEITVIPELQVYYDTLVGLMSGETQDEVDQIQ